MSREFPTVERKPVEQEIEKLPFQRWYPVADLFRKAPDKKQFMDAMKKGGININGENITPIDFFATTPDLSDAETTEAIEAYLDIEIIDTKLEMINKSVAKAKDYIENYLHLNLPKEIKNLDDVRGPADVIKIFRKTAAAKSGANIGLSPAYCALVSVVAAAFEFEKKETDGLMKESEYLYEKMIRKDESTGVTNFHRFDKEKDNDGYDSGVVYNDVKGGTAMCTSYFRGKDVDSLISKFINKPEANAEAATKDGVGFKFEVKSIEDLKLIVPVVARYFKKNFAASDFIFENTKLLSIDEMSKIKKQAEEEFKLVELADEDFLIKDDKNTYANENFKAFRLNGTLQVPVRGDVDGMTVERQFEVQIVLVDNSNETGFSNHFVYEAAKKLSIVTRLFGSFTEEYLNIICEEASRGARISTDGIKEYIKTNFLSEIKDKGYSKKRYASKKNAKRFLKAGIFKNKEVRKN